MPTVQKRVLVKLGGGNIYKNNECGSQFLAELRAANAGHSLDPRPVVRHAHVDTGHVGVGAADAVRHGAHQFPPAVLALGHQGTATVTLQSGKVLKLNKAFANRVTQSGNVN